MNTRKKAPCMREIVESFVCYRKISGLKPLSKSCMIYRLLRHANLYTQGMLTSSLLDWWWEKRLTEQPQSHYVRVISVVSFLKYAATKWDVPSIPAIPKKPHNSEHIPHIFTKEELSLFFHACDTVHKCIRNKESLLAEIEIPVMFRLMYANGLRPNECRLLKRECVDLNTGLIRIEETKGYILHRIVVKPDMLALLCRYDAAADELLHNRLFFFPSSSGRCHNNVWLCRQFNDTWYKHNTAHATSYDLRHNYVISNIYSWKEQGVGYGLSDKLLALSKSLGHSCIASTLYYFSLVPVFEGEMEDSLEEVLERICDETTI